MGIMENDFRKYDADNKGEIPIEAFGEIMEKHSVFGRSKELLHQELANLKKNGQERISLHDYLAFNYFVQHFDDIHKIIKEHAKEGISKGDFSQLLHVAKEGEVDLIFSIFDKQGSGKLDENASELLHKITHPLPKKMTLPQSLLLGAVSAMIGATVVFPIDKGSLPSFLTTF